MSNEDGLAIVSAVLLSTPFIAVIYVAVTALLSDRGEDH